jgi:DNA (cytosine-5)-methyltransferase 1
MSGPLVLSLFPGIDGLGHAFEVEIGACVVRGPDLIYGSLSDVRSFHPPAGIWDGCIGGPPCQTFSALANLVRANGYEPIFGNLIPEFERVVFEAQPAWWVMENVPGAPLPVVDGYRVHAQLLNNRWLGEAQQRVRRISFGTRDGRPLLIDVALFEAPLAFVAVKGNPRPTRREARAVISGNGFGSGSEYYQRRGQAVLTTTNTVPVKLGGSGKVKRTVPASDTGGHGGGTSPKTVRYSIADACELQGFPRDFLEHAPWTAQGKLRAIANAVPLPMGRAIAAAVARAMSTDGDPS